MKFSFSQLTAPVAILIIGFLLVLTGVFDSLPISTPPLVIQSLFTRYVLVILGVILIAIGVVVAWKELGVSKTQKRQRHSKSSPQKANGSLSIKADTKGGDFVIGDMDKSIHISNSPQKPKKK